MPSGEPFTLLISDLHLEAGRPDTLEHFFHFLEHTASGAENLYILGDLFNVWIGDDEDSPINSDVSTALKQLSESGTKIFIMHGNRDFLLGNDYAISCGAELIPDPYLLECYGNIHLLMHGDSLCTLDLPYIRFRDMVRDQDWQKEFLAKPIDERREFAEHARSQSKAMNSNKAEDIMDVCREEVLNIMDEEKINSLIHGHTHRPDVHRFPLRNGSTGERTVLGDWDKGPSYIRLAGPQPELVITG